MSLNSTIFRSFLQEVASRPSIPDFIRQAEARFSIRPYCIGQIDPQQALKLYQSIYNKFYKNGGQGLGSNWFENQLRLFVWVLFCHLHLRDKEIEQLSEPDWQFFRQVFDRKDPRLFEYQCYSLCLENRGKAWDDDEDHLLKTIIQGSVGQPDSQKFKWNEVSKTLFQQSEKKYLRTPKQCRERWNNHLDPSKVKGMWRREQCLMMFEYVQQNGKKWANIVKLLNNTRNEHSIKNKFNSLLKKQSKSHKNAPEEQLYLEIIARIKSAITNDKGNGRGSGLGFDLEDEVNCEPQHGPASEPKVSSFASKLMQKLSSFGNPKNEPPLQKTNSSQPSRQKVQQPGEQAPKTEQRISHGLSTHSHDSEQPSQNATPEHSLNRSLSSQIQQGQRQCLPEDPEDNQFNMFEGTRKPRRVQNLAGLGLARLQKNQY